MKEANDEDNHVQYCSNNSVVVVNPVGKLKQVYVPFPVFSRKMKDGKRSMFIVEEIRCTKEERLVFIINGKAYFHHLFTLTVQF